MFDQLVDPPSPIRHMAAAEFFMSLKKEARVRADARQMLRRVTQTNALPVSAPRANAPKAAPTTVAAMKKQAFIGGALRAVAHSAQGPMAAAAKSVRNSLKSAGQAREGFKAGYTMKDPNFMQRLFSRFKKGSGFGTVQEGKFIPIKSKVIFGQETTPGSEAFLRQLAKKKGTTYADAFRAGRGVKTGVDPDTLAGGARHFVTSKGDITAGSVLKGIHTIGLVSPEFTQEAIRGAIKRYGGVVRPSGRGGRTGLSNNQLMLGGTAAGLGYLALRPKKASKVSKV